MKRCALLAAALFLSLAASCNMPTRSDGVLPIYTSGIAYEPLSKERLLVELDDLKRRESQLVNAQDARSDSSAVQAFLFGFGQGDGIEASELGIVRGNINAVIKALAIKGVVVEVEPEPEPKEKYSSMGSPSSSTGDK